MNTMDPSQEISSSVSGLFPIGGFDDCNLDWAGEGQPLTVPKAKVMRFAETEEQKISVDLSFLIIILRFHKLAKLHSCH